MEQTREPRNKPHLYSQLRFGRGSKHIQWARDSLFNKWCWENWKDTYRNMKLDHLLIPHTRINSKWIKDLNVWPQTIKITEENTGSKILDIAHSNNLYLSRQGEQKKINKWDYVRLKTFCTAKEIINKIKRQSIEWDNIFADISKTYKVLTKLNTKKTNNPIKILSKDPNRHFSKEDIKMANIYMKRCSMSLIIR